jgi:Protein of unknown function (DUF1572)
MATHFRQCRCREYNPQMAHELTTSYLKDSIALFRHYKKMAESAMAQCPDAGLFTTLDKESNSIAIIVKHIAGNMRSRWTNFLTTDGEKPDRDRDSEFEEPPKTRAELFTMWDAGWKIFLETLDSLTDADVGKTVMIRAESHSVMQAINRQTAHYGSHIGQIIFLCKHFASDSWKSVTVPRKGSSQFTADVATGRKSQR